MLGQPLSFLPAPAVLLAFTIALVDGSTVYAEAVEWIADGSTLVCTVQGARKAFAAAEVVSVSWQAASAAAPAPAVPLGTSVAE